MGLRRRKAISPLHQLGHVMGAAAANITRPQILAIKLREAQAIPRTNAEIGGGRKGEMARLGRKTLAELPTTPPDQIEDKAAILRACRDALLSRFEVTSEISLADRRRRHA